MTPPTATDGLGDALRGRPAPGGPHGDDGGTFADALGCCLALAGAAGAAPVADPGSTRAPGGSGASGPVPGGSGEPAAPSDPDAAGPSDPDAAAPSDPDAAGPSDTDAAQPSTGPAPTTPPADAHDAVPAAPAAADRDLTTAGLPAADPEDQQAAAPTVTSAPRPRTDAPQPTSASDASADGAPATTTPGQPHERHRGRAIDEAPAHLGDPQRATSPPRHVDHDAPLSVVRHPAAAGSQPGAPRGPAVAHTATPVPGAADAAASVAVAPDARATTVTAIHRSEPHGDVAPQERPASAPPTGPPPATSSVADGADAVDLPVTVGPPAHPAATEVPEPSPPAPATSRILELVERLRHEPPPRQLVVDLGALGVGRVVVAVRGETVVVGAATPDAPIDPQWLRDLGEALDARGWSLDQRGGRQTDGRRQRPLPPWALPPPPPTNGRGADGALRL